MTANWFQFWRRWAIALLGGVLLTLNLVPFATRPDLPTLLAVLSLVPALLAVGLIVFGVWFAQRQNWSAQRRPVIVWSLAGVLGLGLFGVWEMGIHLLEGEALIQTLHEVMMAATVGAIGGTVIGVYDSHRQEQYRSAERIRQAITASMDGIAILNEDGKYETMNQAHAEVYGYDDSESFIGETWRMCYSETEAARIEEEIMPQLNEKGGWRGELTGQRRDGSLFPQEITLSTRPEGGLICVCRDISDQKEHEAQLKDLHGVTRKFLRAKTPKEITDEMISVAHEMLGYPLTVVWEYDAEDDRLVPLSVTDPARRFVEDLGLEEFPSLESDSAEMDIFQRGEAVSIDDYETLDDRQVTQAPLGEVLFVPLGDYGLFAIGSSTSKSIDVTDRFLGEILASNAHAALASLEHEKQLASRQQRLSTVLENMPVILFAIDQDRKLTLQVGKGLDRVGVEQNQMVGATIEEVFGDSPAILDAINRSLNGDPVDITLDQWGQTYQAWYQPVTNGSEDTSVIGVAMDITERHRRERGIKALHDATREMMQETNPKTICQIAVNTAQNALDLPISGIWLQAADSSQLDPVAWTDRSAELFGELPVCEPGNSLVWQVYEEGEMQLFDNVNREPGRYNSETTIRSELNLPLGEYGVMNIGSTERGVFDETDVTLAKLLAANTRAALERAERERTLQRQTDEMEFFNSILRHDVLNGMTVIRGRADLLTEDLEGEQLRDAETIVRWSDDVVGIVQRVRTVLETLTGDGDISLHTVDLSTALRAEVERVQSTYPTVSFETAVPEGVTVQANDLLGEVLGNLITNAVTHNDPDDLCITVTVEKNDERVTIRIADNGRGVANEKKDAIFRRGETGHVKSTGSGFGLFFVDSMVDAYGGNIRVEDNTPQGAVFVIELQTPGIDILST